MKDNVKESAVRSEAQQNGADVENKMPENDIDNKIKQNIKEISLIQAAGYSVAQYCVDTKAERIIIITEEEYWPLVEQITLSMMIDLRLRIRAKFSEKPFSKQYHYFQAFGKFVTKALDLNSISPDDAVLILKVDPDKTLEKKIVSTVKFRKGRVITLDALITEMNRRIFGLNMYRHFLKKNPNVALMLTNNTIFPTDKQSDIEKSIADLKLTRQDVLEYLKRNERPTRTFDEFEYTNDEYIEMLTESKSYLNDRSVRVMEERTSKCINVINGHRITIGNPEKPKRRVFLIGDCKVFGIGAPDHGTTASYLQTIFNKEVPELAVSVENYGSFLALHHQDYPYLLNSLPVKDGDIVISNMGGIRLPDHDFVVLTDLLKRPHNYGEVFFDIGGHMTENGNRAVADALFKELQKRDYYSEEYKKANLPSSVRQYSRPFMFGIPHWSESGPGSEEFAHKYNKELRDYKTELIRIHAEKVGCIGAIVMNCNPFTLGHRHLIEYAASKVKHLYIFAVEEDRSIFPFADRFELIKAGTADLDNVTVVPSGKFIISSLTFVDYFNKSEIQNRTIDPSLDVTLFAKEIAPALNITVRFVGEEPLDNITKQYNDAMRRILPDHGIEFVEIPRKEFNGEVISASRVRKLLDDKDFDEISKIVPETTLNYLIKKFGD